MSTRRWVLSRRNTAGFVLALGLFLLAGAGGVWQEIQSRPLDAETLATFPPAVQDVVVKRIAVRTARRTRIVALTTAATLMGAILAAATLITLERRTRALLLAQDERARFVRMQEEHAETLVKLREARAEAEKANLSKDQFLSVISHELRNPLHVMLGWIALLKRGIKAGQNVDRALATVERHANLQARMVNDLLDVSRILFDKLTIERRPVDLARVVQGAVEEARPEADEKGLALSCALSFPANAVIGDDKRLRQMVGNLLDNAIKFTSKGGRVTVTLEAREGDEAILSVADTGDGIEPDFLPYVFDRFHLADATRTRQHGGLGLGLTIVKNLTRLHGGRVEAASEGTGKGTRFSLHLPLGPALIEAPAPSSDVHPVSSASSPVLGDLPAVTVLLVEDDPDGREALCLALQQAGAQVHACASPAEARAALERIVPDIVLSDIGMPGESGNAFLRWLRARGDTTPAVAVSGFASREDREEALASGFDAHASKPLDTDALIVTVRKLVRRRRPLRRASGGS
jgi:signal transduction histidine kinase/CheY-like chemotaxis protein